MEWVVFYRGGAQQFAMKMSEEDVSAALEGKPFVIKGTIRGAAGDMTRGHFILIKRIRERENYEGLGENILGFEFDYYSANHREPEAEPE